MSDYLPLPPIPTIFIEESLEHIETLIHAGFERIDDFKESVNIRFEEMQTKMDQITMYQRTLNINQMNLSSQFLKFLQC